MRPSRCNCCRRRGRGHQDRAPRTRHRCRPAWRRSPAGPPGRPHGRRLHRAPARPRRRRERARHAAVRASRCPGSAARSGCVSAIVRSAPESASPGTAATASASRAASPIDPTRKTAVAPPWSTTQSSTPCAPRKPRHPCSLMGCARAGGLDRQFAPSASSARQKLSQFPCGSATVNSRWPHGRSAIGSTISTPLASRRS